MMPPKYSVSDSCSASAPAACAETFVPLWFLCSYVNSFSTSQSARVWDLLFLGARTHGAIAAPAILIQVSCIFMLFFILSYN
jgi:hypothetical protein